MLRKSYALAAVLALFAFVGLAAADAKKGNVHSGVVVKVADGKLTMTDKNGKNEHTHMVAADAKVSCDGKECKLEDLKEGCTVKVTLNEDKAAAKIEAKSKKEDK